MAYSSKHNKRPKPLPAPIGVVRYTIALPAAYHRVICQMAAQSRRSLVGQSAWLIQRALVDMGRAQDLDENAQPAEE